MLFIAQYIEIHLFFTLKLIMKDFLPYKKGNYILIFSGIVSALIGFIFLWFGDKTFSVIFMVIGYLVLIPLGLLLKFK